MGGSDEPTAVASNSSGVTINIDEGQLADQLRRLLHPVAVSRIPDNQLIIVTRSAVDRFKLVLERPVSYQKLVDFYRSRHNGMAFNIFHANRTYDFLYAIRNQHDLDEAVRLHDQRSRDSKFRLYIQPRNQAPPMQMIPDPLGVLRGGGIRDDSAYSETGTSAFTTTYLPAKQRLQQIIAAHPDAPRPPAEWREGRCLGQGAHGRVLLCEERNTGEHLVVKKIYARGDVNSVRRRMLALGEEIDILSRLTHKNIVQYRGVSLADDCINVFMEYMTAGSLYDQLNNNGFGALNARRTIDTTRQILQGLAYLHSLGIVHRDIKSANILLHASPPVVKIGDFGSAQFMRALASLSAPDYCGTPHYTAPETLRDNDQSTEKADIWSIGITMIEMLTTRVPYCNLEPGAVLFQIAKGTIEYTLPPETPPALSSIIARMLHSDPHSRPSAAQLLKMAPFDSRNSSSSSAGH